MPKFSTMPEAIAHNTQGFCNVPECFKHRTGVSAYCLAHRNCNTRYGHPLQKKLLASRHAAERSQVTEIFNSNPNHPGVLSAVRWVQQWIDAAMRSDPTALARDDMHRLVTEGVTARDIVIEAAAQFLFQQANRHKYLNEDSESIALSLAVLHLAPLAKKTKRLPSGEVQEVCVDIKTAPRRKVGRYIRSHLIHLFLNLQKTIEDNRNAALTTREAFMAPLIFPAVLMATTEQQAVDLPWAT